MYLCEYAHAMFNSMGALGEYNDVFDAYPSLLGGAIWEWEDQGIWNRRDPKRQYIAYGGGFGEFPNDHYFIHKGVVFPPTAPKSRTIPKSSAFISGLSSRRSIWLKAKSRLRTNMRSLI